MAEARSVQHKAGSLSEALEDLRFYLEHSSYDRSVLYADSRVARAEDSGTETQTSYLSAIKSAFLKAHAHSTRFLLILYAKKRPKNLPHGSFHSI